LRFFTQGDAVGLGYFALSARFQTHRTLLNPALKFSIQHAGSRTKSKTRYSTHANKTAYITLLIVIF